jgi:hypothetical protein
MGALSSLGRKSAWGNAKISAWLMVVGALCLGCLPALSQTQQGSIRGAVLDQSGGAIAGATVRVTDVARGVTQNLVTDSAGEYEASSLTPSTYSVRAEAKGFKAAEHNGVLVEVGQNLRVDLEVQPGEQTQTVTVSGEIPTVNTTDSTLGGAVSNSSINELPLNGRNFERLLQLRPGTISAVGAGTGTTQTNGRRTANDSLRVEGIAEINSSSGATILNQVYQGGDSSSSVPIDAIQEFSTQENGKAEYGFRDGAAINVAIKSGTNGLHGTAYAFGRDASATDAANPFTHAVTAATMEQFGGSAGGRIIKDKLFWFANFEALRVSVGNLTLATEPVDVALTPANPGASMIDACNTVKAANAATPANPATPPVNALSAQLAGLSHFATGDPTSCAVTPASSTFENLFPYLTTTNTQNNFLPTLVSETPLNNGIFKSDYAISAHHHVSGMVFISKSNSISGTPVPILPQWDTVATNNAGQYAGDWTWIPSSAWVNDLRLGYVFIRNFRVAGDANLVASNPWPNGYGMNTGVTNPLFGGLPGLTFNSFGQLGGGGVRTGLRGPQGDIDFVDSVSYLRGKHALKFGFEYIDVIADGDTYTNSYGTVKFTTLQAFLQGTTNGGSIELGNPAQNSRSHWYGIFAQDDWRLTPRVTLNLGMRYEYYTPPTERNNYIGNFTPNVNPATTPAVQQFGPGAPVKSEYHATLNNVSPRFGLAWDVRGNGKTVLRAGAGILTDATVLGPFIDITPFGENFPSIGVNRSGSAANANSVQTLNLSAGQLNWNTTGPTIFPSSVSQVTNGVTYTGLSCNVAGVGNGPCQTGGVDPNFQHAYATTWNLDIQQAITNKLTLDVAYVGNHGFREETIVDENQPPIGAGWDSSAVTACLNPAQVPLYSKCTPDKNAEVGLYKNVFPYLSNIDVATNGDFSNYDGLQLTFQGRGYYGLSFLAGYTYAHALSENDTNSVNTQNLTPTDKGNLRLNYGNGLNDIRHRFTFSPTYNLPEVKSPGQMLEGWSVNAIVTLQTGVPWNPSDTTTFDWLGTGENGNSGIGAGTTQYWNYTGPRSAFAITSANPIPCFGALKGCVAFSNAALGGPTALAACSTAAQAPYAGNAQLQQLALAALQFPGGGCYMQGGGILTPPAFGTVGNAGKGVFTGPNYRNVDFSIAKLWKLKERYTAQFRMEFFNLFNRADYAAVNSANPSAGGGVFGTTAATPDTTNAVLGSGGPRHIQFGLKLTF